MSRRRVSQARRAICQQMGPLVRSARRSAGLTQTALAKRLGLKPRTISRWERASSAPNQRHLRELANAIEAVRPGAAAALQATLAAGRPTAAPAAPAPAEPVRYPAGLEYAVLRMADELDLPPRRVRRPLVRLLQRAAECGFDLETAKAYVDAWVAREE
jgi:transcriptional regulator with XRE-family HTH domain